MGFERLIIYLTGVDNIRDVIPYFRTPQNCDFGDPSLILRSCEETNGGIRRSFTALFCAAFGLQPEQCQKDASHFFR